MTLAHRVTALAQAETRSPRNAFGPAFLEEHLAVVVALARRLAPALGADPDRVEVAGWLHDLAAVRDLACLATHAADGAALARRLLPDLGASPGDVAVIADAIASHSAPVAPGQGSPEAICLAAADVLSHLERPAFWFHYLHRVRGFDAAGAAAWFRGRAETAWAALPEAARALGGPRARVLALLAPPPAP